MDPYEKFRAKIDASNPIPSPATKGKVELEILRLLLTPEEAEFASNLSGLPETAGAIAARLGVEEAVARTTLDELVRKGTIFKVYLDDPLYCLFPMMPGIYEFQVGRLTPEKVRLFERYYAEGHGEAVFRNKTAFSRVVPVNQAIRRQVQVLTYEEVEGIIDRASAVTLTNCLCRTNKKMVGEGCDAPAEDICILLDSWAVYYATNGLGRSVGKEEGKAALKRAEEAGLVHSALNVQEGALFVCNCCGCCCALLRGITQLKIPTAVARSNFVAEISETECSGCAECVDRCHVQAIRVEDMTARLAEEACIGCGLCSTHCSTGAISMRRRGEPVAPPSDMGELMARIAQGRN